MPRPSINILFLIGVSFVLLIIACFRLQADNSAGHMDEYDYLFVGKTLLAGGHWPTHTYIFGWDLNWLALAWGDVQLGGIAGARRITALLGLLSIAGMYWFVLLLWRNHTTSVLAALLLSLEAAHLYSSNLATYDIISFTFFIWSLPTLILACRTHQYRRLCTFFSALLLIAAVLSKYTALVYLPFIALFVLFIAPKQAIAGILLITAAIATYTIVHFDQLQVLFEIQINGAHDKNATSADILMRTGRQLLVLLLLTALCFGYALIYARSQLPRLLCLLFMALPLFMYHLLGQNVISLQKHLLYSSLFLIPIMAWGIQQLMSHPSLPTFSYALAASVLVLFGISNYRHLQTMQNSYPDVQPVTPIAERIMAHESVLSEDPYLFRYLLHDRLDQQQISETTWLDNNRDGIHEHRDVQQAVWDRKFNYVFLNDQQHASGNKRLREMMVQRGYIALLKQPYELETMSGDRRTGIITLHARPNSSITMLSDE